ncbi:hypothetical protein X943_001509 [Babesia divergens]|uniref:BRCT domain-containing protein n=1 Tax=Babesia divergens TaxID=32595 RepID=A0AAD9LK21_BABDI|nr:hypothetical protein X943_001509 [Babesia divergens]
MMFARGINSDSNRSTLDYDSCLEGFLEASEQLERCANKLLDLTKSENTTPLKQDDRQVVEDVLKKITCLRSTLGRRNEIGLSALLGSNRVKTGLTLRTGDSNRSAIIRKKVMGDSRSSTGSVTKPALTSANSEHGSHLTLSASFSNVPSMSDSLVLNRRPLVCPPPMSQMSQTCTPQDNGTGKQQSDQPAGAIYRGDLSLGDLDTSKNSAFNSRKDNSLHTSQSGSTRGRFLLGTSKYLKTPIQMNAGANVNVASTEDIVSSVSEPATESCKTAAPRKRLKKAIASETSEQLDIDEDGGAFTQLMEPATLTSTFGLIRTPQSDMPDEYIGVSNCSAKVRQDSGPTSVINKADIKPVQSESPVVSQAQSVPSERSRSAITSVEETTQQSTSEIEVQGTPDLKCYGEVGSKDASVIEEMDKVSQETVGSSTTVGTAKRSPRGVQNGEPNPKKTKIRTIKGKPDTQVVTEEIKSQTHATPNKTTTASKNNASELMATKATRSIEKTSKPSKKKLGDGTTAKSPSKIKTKRRNSVKSNNCLLLSYTGKRRDDIVKRLMKAAIYYEKESQYFDYLDEPKDEHITHLIAPSDIERPTLKVLYALCQGAYILTPDYLYKAEKTEKWPNEIAYEHPRWPPRSQRLRPFDLMSGITMKLIGGGKKLSAYDVGRLAIHCGARVVETIDEATHCVVSDGTKPEEIHKENIPKHM